MNELARRVALLAIAAAYCALVDNLGEAFLGLCRLLVAL